MNNSTFELGKFPSRNAIIGQMKNRFSSLFSVIMASLGRLLWLVIGQNNSNHSITKMEVSSIPTQWIKTNRGKQSILLLIALMAVISAKAQSPGGVATSLSRWYKADFSASSTSWADASPNSKNSTTKTGTVTWISNGANFNPYVNFNSGYFSTPAAFQGINTDNTKIFTVNIPKSGSNNTSWGQYATNGLNIATYNPYNDDKIYFDAPYAYRVESGSFTTNGGVYGVPTLMRASKFGGTNYVHLAGTQIGSAGAGAFTGNYPGGAQSFYLGAQNGATSDNNLVELIVYENASAMSATQVKQIESYLSIKYGITYKEDYLSSDGSTIYTATTGGYNSNIFGMGRDDASSLNQKQSKSVNASSMVTISNAATVAATNAANTSTFSADKSFEMIGDNGLASSYATAYTPNSFTPTVPTAFFGMSRIWKVQETGTVGTVTISVPAGAERLLVFAAGTTNFASGAVQEIAMVSDGAGNVTAQVNFTNGQLFTFGKVVVAPGCVSQGLDFWLDPATNVTKSGSIVTGWSDADAGGNNPALVQATTALQPAFSAGDAMSNYNPYINFTGNERLNTPVTGSNYSSNITTFGVVSKLVAKGSYNNFIRFTDTNNSDAGTHNWGLGTSDITEDKVSLHYISAPFVAVAPGNVWNRLNGNKLFTLNTPTIMSGTLNATTGATAVGNNGNEAYATGKSGGTFVPYNFLTVGGGNSYGMNNNKTSEIIHYSRELTIQERQRVQTYLAIKYGITLDKDDNSAAIVEGDYILGDGTTKVWDKTANNTYHNDVFGIGRDDCQALIQKQSKSVNTSALVTISNAATVAATNAANTSTFVADKSFDVIGDNGLAASYATAYTPNSFTPTVPTAFFGMSRIWKVQETGTVGTVTISVPEGPERLLVFAAGTTNFASGAVQEIAMVSDGAGNVTAQVDFTNGQLFTFGKVVVAPGCVAGNLKAWLKADIGTNTITDGSNVTSWANNGASGGNAVQVGTNNVPKYLANKHNFNPALDVATAALNTGLVLNDVFAGEAQRELTFYTVGSRSTYPAGYWMGWGGFYNGNDNNDNPWIGNYGANFYYWNGSGSGVNDIGGLGMPDYVANQTYISGLTQLSGALEATSGTNFYSNGQGIPFTGNTAGTRTVSPDLKIYHDNNTYAYGSISEVIAYDRVLTLTDRQKLESYLAIKYGITLGYNYLSGAGSTIYDRTTYQNNIFGIGRDDCQALIQKQSKSVNTSAFVTISNATTVAATNVANTSTFAADKVFEMIGDNGLAASYATAYTPNSFTPTVPTAFFGMSRIWKVQETGTVGTVTISVPEGPERLLVFPAGTTNFASGATQEILMVSDGNGNVTAQVNFTDGQLFTFGKIVTAPGCVTAGLQLWLKADVSGITSGTSAIRDYSPNGKDVPKIGTTNLLQTADAAHNFNAYLSGFSASNYFLDTNSPLEPTGIFQASEVTMIAAVRPTSAGTGRIMGIDDNVNFASEPDLSIRAGKPAYYKYRPLPSQYVDHTSVAALNQTSIFSARTNNTQIQVGLNGSFVSEVSTAGNGLLGTNLNIGYGTWASPGAFPGDIQEVIWYKSSLSDPEVQKIQSYLAIKYGTTLGMNYLTGAGTIFWDKTANSTYHNNVFGIGRDDCQSLNQKQSNSTSSSVVTLGIDNKIMATNAANTGTFDNNATFLMWGDNGLATGTTTSVTASPCNPESIDKYTAKIWKSVETGSVESTKVSVDLGSYAFNANYPVYMQVASNDNFASFENVLMVKNGANYETNFDFTGTQYIRFTGNTTPPANVCTGDKEYRWNSPTFWNWGTKTRTSVLGDTQFKVTISDPNNVIYAPTVYPVGQYWWEHLFIPRYDAIGTNVITTRIEMNKVAYKTSFEIFDLDAYYGKDVVKVYGKLAGAIVNPVLTLPKHTALSVAGNVVSATTGVWDISIWGRVYVNFNSPIDEIYVEYSKSGGYNFKTYQDVRISNIDVTCKPYVPEVVSPDNVYIAKQVTKAAPKVGEPFKYKFTVKNLSCNPKTINFTDILPAGSNLKWVDSTLVTSMTYTSASSYGGTQALTITGLSVPVGESYLYINAVGTTAGTYDNQASFTVGANSYLSDEPNIAGGANPTPVTLTADRPLSNLTITKAVSKTTAAQNEVIKYTYTITNPNASAVLTNFEDNLPNSVDGAFKYVAGSLSGATGATAVPSSYGGESSLTLTNLSIPTSGLTFSISVNTGSYTQGGVGSNVASISADPSTIYNTKPVASNTVNTTIAGGCSAGADAPAFAKTAVSNICPSTTVNLTAMVATNLPVGTTVTWHTTANASNANLVPNTGAVPAGTYYAAFYDAANTCYSGAGSATTLVTATVVGCPSNITVSNACPATTVDLTTRATGPYPSGKTLTWHTGTPTTNANKISNAATAGNGTYYAAYYDATNDCYSPATSNAIVVNILACATCTAGSTAPSLSSTSLTNLCPETTVDLSKVTASNVPSGSVLAWYKTATPSNADALSGINAIGAGTYYAAFYDFAANCFSPSTQVTVTATTCQNDLYVDLTTAISQPSPALAVATPSNITVTVSNSGTGPTLTGRPTNTTIALPTGVSAPATFSSNGWNCVTTGQAIDCSTNNIIAATNGSSAFVVPITPDASTLGTKPTITADTAPYIIELTTNNNGATMTPTTAVVAPDLTTTIGQPATPLFVGVASNIPVTVANIGTGPTTGSPITTTIALPSGVTSQPSFTSGAWGCTTTGSTVSCTTAGPIANGANSSFNVPITPSVAGSTPVISGGTVPAQGEVVTNNNGATMTPTVPVAGVPDLTTSIGQPTTTLTAGVASNIPVTVTNIGGGSTTGSPITTTMTLPAGVTAPATFSSNGWACTTVGSTINCTTAGPIASGGGTTTFNVPVTPNASTVGTSPVFSAGTAPTTNEVATGNNTATMTPSTPVAAGAVPDLTMSIGQPATPLRIGNTSDIPVTVTNTGTAATSGGTITTTMTLPANVTAPATFASNGWNCATAGSAVSCSITTTLTAGGGTSTFNVPVTPIAAAAGTTPTFTGGTAPTVGETATANNTASMTPTAAILGRPDLTTSIGQPSPALQQGRESSLPVTVTNIGNAPTTGASITTTVGLPSGVSAPASFSNNGWNCSTVSSVVTCSTPTPLNGGGATSIFNVPITPNASTVGTTPSFTGGTSPDPSETVTGNNTAPTLVSSPAVTGLPDLTTSIGQPSPALSAGVLSNVPMTVTNIGTGPANGPIVTTMTLPAGTSASANFTDGPWTCATTGQTVACTTAGPIAANGGFSTVNVPVTPTAAIIGTTPPFNATTNPIAGEPNTTNNNATPMTPSTAVAGCATASVGGTVNFAGTLPVCNAANGGTLTLTGNTGAVVKWQTSSNNWISSTDIANTSTTYSFMNAANGQQYRAVVQNSTQCAAVNATPVTITTSAGACSATCDYAAPVIVK